MFALLRPFYNIYEKSLLKEMKDKPFPMHIAIIMDGNRRFADKLNMQTNFGHSKGAETIENVIEWSYEYGIKELTVYAFSTENFQRSDYETTKLFELITNKFEHMRKSEKTHKRKIRVRAVGELELLPPKLYEAVSRIEDATKNYDKFKLNVAIAYGGRQDIVQAVQSIAYNVLNNSMSLNDINEETISQHLYPSQGTPVSDVDLIIRTGGNERISNFLPWQANGNECASYFCAPLWPEFRKIDFLRAIRVYQTRLVEKQEKKKVREKFLQNIT